MDVVETEEDEVVEVLGERENDRSISDLGGEAGGDSGDDLAKLGICSCQKNTCIK